jgi:predicted metal-dependent hydrolase
MKKSDRLTAFVEQLDTDTEIDLDPCYQGYFTCFNAGNYYEAHDVLEHLWLKRRDENYEFYKGLIQIAGAFVHLKLQSLYPDHPKHGRRLQPAVRLFLRGIEHIAPYGPRHLRLDVAALCRLCTGIASEIAAGEFSRNPWDPARMPRLELSTHA